MGQSESNNSFPEAVEFLPSAILRQAKTFTEISVLTYDEFLVNVDELNSLSQQCMDASNRQLIFAIEKGTDSSLFWKATIKIACYRYKEDDNVMECCRIMNLAQFLKIFKTLKTEILTAQQINASTNHAHVNNILQKVASSVELNSMATNSSNECCICFEREHEITLPCTHSFCEKCIDEWNVNNKTCPICREVTGSDEEWVLSNAPKSAEIDEHILSKLMNIATK